jgi:hypothetical protein
LFRLVGLLLQATLGAVAADFRPQLISDRVFKFVVAFLNVDFHIYSLRTYSYDQYQLFFNLRGDGGAHWTSEYKKFVQE